MTSPPELEAVMTINTHLDPCKLHTTLRTLEISNHPDLTDLEFQKIILHCPSLETLELKNCPLLGDSAIQILTQYTPSLRALYWIGPSQVTQEGYQALCHLNLSFLSLSGSSLSSSACHSLLHSTPTLAALDVSFCPLDDRAFHDVRSPLRFLNLQGCSGITDETLHQLSKASSLKHLFLAYSDQLTPTGLQTLSSLETLRISHCANLELLDF